MRRPRTSIRGAQAMRTLGPLILLASLSGACSGGDEGADAVTDVSLSDTDGDGITDVDEATLGTDPEKADTDDDGLLDGVELELGTDPQIADTDGDGYPDGAEVAAGKNPIDASEPLYSGGWPFWAGKDTMESGGFEPTCPGPVACACTGDDECDDGNCHQWPQGSFCAPAVGTRVPRFVGVDQFGERVELYDFAYQGKLVFLDMSTGWCQPCQELAQWFANGDETLYAQSWWQPEWAITRDLVLSGEVYWITVLYENADHQAADAAVARFWHDAFPNDQVPVLADENKDLHGWLKPSGIPNVHVLDEELRFLVYASRGAAEAFEYLAEHFGD